MKIPYRFEGWKELGVKGFEREIDID